MTVKQEKLLEDYLLSLDREFVSVDFFLR